MGITTSDIIGSDQVGIYLAVCGNVVFHPAELGEETCSRIDEYIGLERHAMSIGGSNLVGALIAGTTKGLAVADIATERDIDALTSFGDVVVMEGGVNTAGNLLLCNENGAIASPAIPEDGVEIISEVIGGILLLLNEAPTITIAEECSKKRKTSLGQITKTRSFQFDFNEKRLF